MELTLPCPSKITPRQHHCGLVDQWLTSALPASVALGELAESTPKTYRRAATLWFRHLEGNDTPTPANVREWVAGMRTTSISASTISTYLAAIKAFYRWTESTNSYPNIARAVRAPRVVKDSPLPCPSAQEVSGMFHSIDSNCLKGKRDRALLAVMYSTAMRCISLCRATVGDVDLSAGTIRHQPKGHRVKDALAILSPSAVDAMSDYLATRGTVSNEASLFIAVGNHHSTSTGLTSRAMRALIVSLTEGIGLARRADDGHIRNPGCYSAHSIRRAAVTAAAEQLGMDAAQTLAGHASVDTTRRAYARVNKYRQLQATAHVLDFT